MKFLTLPLTKQKTKVWSKNIIQLQNHHFERFKCISNKHRELTYLFRSLGMHGLSI